MKLMTCKKCGWVHMAIKGLKETACYRCGGSYKDFRDFKEGDCSDGCTLQGIRMPDAEAGDSYGR